MKVWDYHTWYETKPDIKVGDILRFYDKERIVLSVIDFKEPKRFNEIYKIYVSFITTGCTLPTGETINKNNFVIIGGKKKENQTSFHFTVIESF